MTGELKKIKKKYGENFAKMCREMFPIILEEEGLLYEIITKNFNGSHYLYDDIVNNNLEVEFKNYVYNIFHDEIDSKVETDNSPSELLESVGYDLYECKTEEDIQSFRKYYAHNEELCTFKGGRLDKCRVFWVVKKNVDEIRRENFTNPKRGDEYGTSVMSIQFTNDGMNTLSIKNRYNHRVNNPDATYSNNLDNIVEGLTDSFAKYYGIVQVFKSSGLEIPGYVRANDGKYYKYNYEINNIYYCPDNIVIDNFVVKRLESEKYIVLDYFILDLVSKEIKLYDNSIKDSFLDSINELLQDRDNTRINVVRKDDTKVIEITNKDRYIKIVLDAQNRIIKYTNNFVGEIGDNFLHENIVLDEIGMPNVKKIGNYFLINNKKLEVITLENLVEVGDSFLFFNVILRELNMPKLKIVGDNFLEYNKNLVVISLEYLEEVGTAFVCHNNRMLRELNTPRLKRVGLDFMHSNTSLERAVIDLSILNRNDRRRIINILNNNKSKRRRT